MRPGDLGNVVRLHGLVYAREHGFDKTFEAYVAEPLATFVLYTSPRERIWLAESAGELVGCVAIVEVSRHLAQLRWFLVAPDFRGAGLGGRLLDDALAFCRSCAYETVMLWTVGSLTAATRLYRARGFEKVEDKPGKQWGVEVVEERYEMRLEARRD